MNKKTFNPAMPYGVRNRYSNAASTGAPTLGTPNVDRPKKFDTALFGVSLRAAPSTLGALEVESVSYPQGYVPAARASQPVSPSVSGSIILGDTEYPRGTVLTLKATASANGRFVGWIDKVDGNTVADPASTGRTTRSFVVNGESVVTALFESTVRMHTLRANWYAPHGNVVASPDLETYVNMGYAQGSLRAEEGSSVVIKAVPKAGYEFERWEPSYAPELLGNLADDRQTVKLTRDLAVRAVFRKTTTSPDPADGQGTGTEHPDHADGADLGPGGHVVGNGADGLGPDEAVGAPPIDGATAPAGTVAGFVRKWWWAVVIALILILDEKGGGK